MIGLLLNIFNLLIIVAVLNKVNVEKHALADHEYLPVPSQYLYCVVPREYILDAQGQNPRHLPAETKGPYSFFTRLNQRQQPERVEITEYGSISANQV